MIKTDPAIKFERTSFIYFLTKRYVRYKENKKYKKQWFILLKARVIRIGKTKKVFPFGSNSKYDANQKGHW